jgi:hypothetical protein
MTRHYLLLFALIVLVVSWGITMHAAFIWAAMAVMVMMIVNGIISARNW